jgi:sulfur carrier protein
MEVTINGERRAIHTRMTVADLLAELNLGGRRIAVEINCDVVPRAEYGNRILSEGDQVEIVHFVGGG